MRKNNKAPMPYHTFQRSEVFSKAINCALKVLVKCTQLDTEIKLPKEATPEMERVLDTSIDLLYYTYNNKPRLVAVKIKQSYLEPVIFFH